MADADLSSTSDDEKTSKAKRTAPGGKNDRTTKRSSAQRPESSLNIDELRELIELIAGHGLTDFELEQEGFRLRLRRDPVPQPASTPSSNAAVSSAATPTETSSEGFTTSSTASASPSVNPSVASSEPLSTATTSAEATDHSDQNLHTIASPIVGTFYRSPSPTSPQFVQVGDQVEVDQVVCIIEAMKLMNEIQADVSGVVERIYVENGQAVEYGQPLFGIRKQ